MTPPNPQPEKPAVPRIEEIRARLKAIHHKEWALSNLNSDLIFPVGYEESAPICIMAGARTRWQNSDLIANAPSDIQFLLAQLTALEAERDAAIREVASTARELGLTQAKALALEAENQKLRVDAADYRMMLNRLTKAVLDRRIDLNLKHQFILEMAEKAKSLIARKKDNSILRAALSNAGEGKEGK